MVHIIKNTVVDALEGTAAVISAVKSPCTPSTSAPAVPVALPGALLRLANEPGEMVRHAAPGERLAYTPVHRVPPTGDHPGGGGSTMERSGVGCSS